MFFSSQSVAYYERRIEVIKDNVPPTLSINFRCTGASDFNFIETFSCVSPRLSSLL